MRAGRWVCSKDHSLINRISENIRCRSVERVRLTTELEVETMGSSRRGKLGGMERAILGHCHQVTWLWCNQFEPGGCTCCESKVLDAQCTIGTC